MNNPTRTRGGTLLGAAALLALLTACASTPPPTSQMAVSQSSVDRAGSAAAADAPLELAAARDKLNRANDAMVKKDYDLARRLAEEADADAVLAEAKARATRSDRALNEIRASIRQLREQLMNRPG